MSDFRFLAVQYLRAQTLTQITDLARRSYKGFSPEEREALITLARAVTREIIANRKECRKAENNGTGTAVNVTYKGCLK